LENGKVHISPEFVVPPTLKEKALFVRSFRKINLEKVQIQSAIRWGAVRISVGRRGVMNAAQSWVMNKSKSG
jgi:hypothetical protein